ncbi:MAG: DNA recombination protein RmuC [Pseudomonadota bacterium]
MILDLQAWMAEAPEPALWGAVGAAAAILALALFAVIGRLFAGRSTAALRDLSARLTEIAASGERGRTETLRLMEARLDAVAERLGGGLAGVADRTAQRFGEIGERLEAIDRAQAAIEKLSGEMLGLQDILANKQARGAFGETQLEDLLRDALPPALVARQATLSNGKRVDALIRLPAPPGPIAIDAKFPLEPFEALRAAQRDRDPEGERRAERALAAATRAHIAAIAERYLIPGETAEGALMFIPSEAVFAEIHARLPEVVRNGFAKRVWMVSPTTMMATLITLRGALRDMEIQAEAGDLRREVRLLAADVTRLYERSEQLRGHLGKAETDLREIALSAEKSLARARRMDEGA